MVVQKSIDNLKDRPKDERNVVAGGIAIMVVVVLLFAWAILFFKRIQSGAQTVNLSGGAQDEFNFSSVREAQQALEQEYSDTTDEYRELRESAAASQVQGTRIDMQQSGSADPFGSGN
jgi:uncharacterized membrane protein